jgi:transposase
MELPALELDNIYRVYAEGPEAVVALVTSLLEQVTTQEQTIARLSGTITQLTARVQDLEDRLSRSSHNSSQPPASDGFLKQPRTRSLRKRSGKPSGGQEGHAGHTLTLTDSPDEVTLHRPTHCASCGASLDGVPPNGEPARHQVIDLPPLRLHTVEHQVERVCCPVCLHLTVGQCPSEAIQPVQYGPVLKAWAVYLRIYQLLPSKRTCELLSDLFEGGPTPGEGTVACALQECAAQLQEKGVLTSIREGVAHSEVGHFDETGLYVADKRYWLHVACTSVLTYYYWHPKRGKEGSGAAGVLPHFVGTAVHDAYAPFWAYGCPHALCNAHLLRELIFVAERHKQEWATQMQELLREMLIAVSVAREGGVLVLPEEMVWEFEGRYQQIVEEGLVHNPMVERGPSQQPRRGRVKQSKARNLLERLRTHAEEVLRFMHDLRVPFDNNQAERDLRMMKVQQKISGRFRSEEGATAFCQIRSYISTMRKQGQPVLVALEQAFRGSPLFPVTYA